VCGLPYEISGANWQIVLPEAQGTLQGLKTGNKQSNCAQTLLDNDHSVGRIEDMLSVLHVIKKKRRTNTLATCPVF